MRNTFVRLLAVVIVLAATAVASVAAPSPNGNTAAQVTVQPNVTRTREADEAAFTPDGALLAVNERTRVKLWQIATRRPLRSLEYEAYFEHIAFMEDGHKILSVHKDGFLRVWDTSTGALVHEYEIPGFDSVRGTASFHYDDKNDLCVVAEYSGNVTVWKAGDGQLVYRLPAGEDTAKGEIVDAAASANGRDLVVQYEKAAEILDLATKTPQQRPIATIKQGQILADAKRIAGGTTDGSCGTDVLSVGYESKGAPLKLDGAIGCPKAGDGSEQSSGQLSIFPGDNVTSLLITRTDTNIIKLIDAVSGTIKRTIPRHFEAEEQVIAADAKIGLAASLTGGKISIISLTDGLTVATLRSFGSSGELTFAAADGQRLLMSPYEGPRHPLVSWPVAGVSPTISNLPEIPDQHLIDVATGPNTALFSDGKSAFSVYDLETGTMVSRIKVPDISQVNDAHLSPDGTRILLIADSTGSAGGNELAFLLESRSGRTLKVVGTHAAPRKPMPTDAMGGITSSAFSADGARFAIGFRDGIVEVWNSATLKPILQCDPGDDQTTALLFSGNGRLLVGGSRDSGIYVWELKTGKLLRTLDREGNAGHVSTAGLAISSDGTMIAAGPNQRAVSSGDIGAEHRIQVWDVATGKRRFYLSGHESDVSTILFSSDGRWIVSGSVDGTIRYWDRKTGALAATFALAADGRWAIITDKGFFAASANESGDLLSVVRGNQATSIDQMWQSLYAPDLVRERLLGDLNGEYRTAADNAELSVILDSGPAPTVRIEAPPSGATSAKDLITLSARIADAGKGIGRIEWRVNGVTTVVANGSPPPASAYESRQQIALDPGSNDIEVVAYDSRNLLASTPAHLTITYAAASALAKPRLHVLAIGINAYTDQGSITPSTGHKVQFKPLKLAVHDAESLADNLKRAAAGLYEGDPDIVVLRNAEATRSGIAAAIDRMAAAVGPRDTFIFFAAAHGTTKAGRFYLIPQDYDGGIHPVWLEQRAIGPAMLQDWFANKIKAKRALILLDTCESGALVAGYLRPRSEDSASEAGIGRLHEATGRPVLTAAASGQFAYEGVVSGEGERHGVFTWALIQALHHADTDFQGDIRLSSLVSYVEDSVPKLAAARNGFAEGRAATGASAIEEHGDPIVQSARFGSHGEDFLLLKKLP